jgi:oligopeptide transport system ATP-binding protein
MTAPILAVQGLVTSYWLRRGLLGRTTTEVQAVAGVDLEVLPGETVGLVGESGCGKTTVARSIAGLTRPKAGRILLEGRDLLEMSSSELRDTRRTIQMVFQDPYSSLDPRMTVRQLVSEGWEIHPDIVPRVARQAELVRLLALVGLDPAHLDRYPHQFSGGQRQRIGIARALALRPRIIVCDEPISALDVSIQAQVINLLTDLQAELGLAYLFISHDLSVVRHVADRVAVMYLGRIVETGPTERLYSSPSHPYTAALMSAALPMEPWAKDRPKRIVLVGDVPSPTHPPSGCRFHTRCWLAQSLCGESEPQLTPVEAARDVACHFPLSPQR